MASRSAPAKLRDPFAEDPEENTCDIVGGTYDDPSDDGPQARALIHRGFPGENSDGVRTAIYHRNSDGGFDMASNVTVDQGSTEKTIKPSSERLDGPPGCERWGIEQWTTWYEETTGLRLEAVGYTDSPMDLAPGGYQARGWWYTFYSQNHIGVHPIDVETISRNPRYYSNVKGRFLVALDGRSGDVEDGENLFVHHLTNQLDPRIRMRKVEETSAGNLNAEINRSISGVDARDFAHE